MNTTTTTTTTMQLHTDSKRFVYCKKSLNSLKKNMEDAMGNLMMLTGCTLDVAKYYVDMSNGDSQRGKAYMHIFLFVR